MWFLSTLDSNLKKIKMDILNTIFGLLAIGFGIYSFIIRRNNPDKFGKLEKMKQFYGDKVGNVIHSVF